MSGLSRYEATYAELEAAQMMSNEEAAARSAALQQTHQPIRGFYGASSYSPYAQPRIGAELDSRGVAHELGVRVVDEVGCQSDDTYLVAPYCIMNGEQVAARSIALWLRLRLD